MTCKGNQQKQVQKHKAQLQSRIFFLFGKDHKHACHCDCGISSNAPLDHIFADQAAEIFFVVNAVI